MFFLYYIVVLWSCQVSASILDPSLISKELQNFARDALGVEEMQVKTFILFKKVSSQVANFYECVNSMKLRSVWTIRKIMCVKKLYMA